MRDGDPSYTFYNGRGDVVAKTDDSSSLTFQAAYEAFGARTAHQGAALDRQKASTKDEDPTGLLNEGFRYRDLETGAFITRDPLGFVDGPNLYTYVVQNPWTKVDPSGLAADEESTDSAGGGNERAPQKRTYTPDGHHSIPRAVQEKHGFSDDVRAALDRDRIKGYDETGTRVKHGAAAHPEYSARVDKEVAKLVAEQQIDPSKLRGDSAEVFARQLRERIDNSKDAYIRGYNDMVRGGATQAELKLWGKEMLRAEREAKALGRVIDAGRTAGRWIGKGALVLTVVTVAADTIQAGPSEAAKNFVKDTIAYDVTLKPFGLWYTRTYDQAGRGGLNPGSPLGNYLNAMQRATEDPDSRKEGQ